MGQGFLPPSNFLPQVFLMSWPAPLPPAWVPCRAGSRPGARLHTVALAPGLGKGTVMATLWYSPSSPLKRHLTGKAPLFVWLTVPWALSVILTRTSLRYKLGCGLRSVHTYGNCQGETKFYKRFSLGAQRTVLISHSDPTLLLRRRKSGLWSLNGHSQGPYICYELAMILIQSRDKCKSYTK